MAKYIISIPLSKKDGNMNEQPGGIQTTSLDMGCSKSSKVISITSNCPASLAVVSLNKLITARKYVLLFKVIIGGNIISEFPRLKCNSALSKLNITRNPKSLL